MPTPDNDKPTNPTSPMGQWMNAWMSGLGQLNPAANSDLFRQWERFATDQLDRLVRSDAFLSQMAKGLEGSFVMRSQMNRLLEQSLRSMRMPTVGDMEALHKRLDEVERRIDGLMEAVDGVARRLDAVQKAEPAAAKKPAPAKKATPAKRPRAASKSTSAKATPAKATGRGVTSSAPAEEK